MKSPFKFLDPYGPGDRHIFFGRDEEIEELYQLVFQANLVLVYGPSGAGKTSLIDCGLASRFQPNDWLPMPVRRQKDINAALAKAIRDRATTRIADDATTVDAVRSLYLDHLRPIYLILDQFEELFILGTALEQDQFFATVAELLASDVSCKLVFCLREESVAALHRFEKSVPTLYSKRLRLEPMSMANVRMVIVRTTAAFGIELENGEATAQKIIDNLDDGRLGVELADLQVYLDGLYRRAAAASGDGPIALTDAAIDETGKLQDMMEDFLEEQEKAIQARLEAKEYGARTPLLQRLLQWILWSDGTDEADRQAVRRVLERFVTSDGTKRPRTRNELANRLPAIEPWLDDILFGLGRARIIHHCDGLFELAHDILARSIAARRSLERRMVIQTERLLRDRMGSFELDKKFLDSTDLALVRQNRTELDLSDEEIAFVNRSTIKARWRRFRWSIFSGCLFILSLPGLIFLWVYLYYEVLGWG